MRDELTSPYLLYGMPASLYTAKARSYLRKRGVGHVELAAGDPRYTDRVMPAIGRWIIPVLETPSGDLIQDTTEIVDHLEEHLPEPPGVYPETPLQRCVAHVLELFGGEGLLRPAMHYRWDFDEANLAFLAHDFGLALAPGGGAEERRRAFEGAEALMRRATRSVGVTAETAAIVEESYEEFLRLLDSHLATAPYLLGGRPTIADLGFIGPLHAHLARDPYPSALMKRMAGNVWRWVERMNAPVDDTGEYLDLSPALFSDDSVSRSYVTCSPSSGPSSCRRWVALAAIAVSPAGAKPKPAFRPGLYVGKTSQGEAVKLKVVGCGKSQCLEDPD
ncbi:MAG TPA: glutathione S-transferase family protein, partial [Solirubrobacterales bacterium]|nr:glutathione S-transferase family protein [Solirubrobacterales bacterium]